METLSTVGKRTLAQSLTLQVTAKCFLGDELSPGLRGYIWTVDSGSTGNGSGSIRLCLRKLSCISLALSELRVTVLAF